MSEFKIDYYESEEGIYCKVVAQHYLYLSTFLVNGLIPQPTHHASWFFVGTPPQEGVYTLQRKGSITRENHRWELINLEDAEVYKVPTTLTKEEAHSYYDEDDYQEVIGSSCEYYKLRNLYTYTSDVVPAQWEDAKFVATNKGKLSSKSVSSFEDVKVTTVRGNYEGSPRQHDLSRICSYSELDEMLNHPLTIHNLPCKIGADTTYAIIRNYVKDNIDNYYAHISSDYEFCFTVKKRLRIKPYTQKTEQTKSNGRSYAKPRFSSRVIDNKSVEIFEMCPSKKYQKYTPIKGFEGENLADLAENIKLFLDELMGVINAPLHECSHCDGTGVVLQEKIESNRR